MSQFPTGELAVYLIVGILIILTLALMVWIYRDAESRGKSGVLMVILIGLVAWPWGIIIWLAARPKVRVLRAVPSKEDIDCPLCGMRINAGWTACKNCSYQNQEVIQ